MRTVTVGSLKTEVARRMLLNPILKLNMGVSIYSIHVKWIKFVHLSEEPRNEYCVRVFEVYFKSDIISGLLSGWKNQIYLAVMTVAAATARQCCIYPRLNHANTNSRMIRAREKSFCVTFGHGVHTNLCTLIKCVNIIKSR